MVDNSVLELLTMVILIKITIIIIKVRVHLLANVNPSKSFELKPLSLAKLYAKVNRGTSQFTINSQLFCFIFLMSLYQMKFSEI